MKNINISDANRYFQEFISRAANGERFVILRHGRPLAAIIGTDDLARLERSAEIAHRLTRALGQSKKLLESIESGKVHPAMAAYGLWKDEGDLADLNETVKKDRRRPSSRLKFEEI